MLYGTAQLLTRSGMVMRYWPSSIDTSLKKLKIWLGWCLWWRRSWISICCLWCGGWYGVIEMILGVVIFVWRLIVSEIKHTPFCRISYWSECSVPILYSIGQISQMDSSNSSALQSKFWCRILFLWRHSRPGCSYPRLLGEGPSCSGSTDCQADKCCCSGSFSVSTGHGFRKGAW